MVRVLPAPQPSMITSAHARDPQDAVRCLHLHQTHVRARRPRTAGRADTAMQVVMRQPVAMWSVEVAPKCLVRRLSTLLARPPRPHACHAHHLAAHRARRI